MISGGARAFPCVALWAEDKAVLRRNLSNMHGGHGGANRQDREQRPR